VRPSLDRRNIQVVKILYVLRTAMGLLLKPPTEHAKYDSKYLGHAMAELHLTPTVFKSDSQF
jgi:hypothetical protein